MKKTMFALAALAFSAAAAQANPYVGVGAGVSNVDINCEGAQTCDDRGTGFKVYGGYQFTPNVAGELVYLNFGTVHVADPGVSLDLKAHGFGGGVAFHVPLATQWNFVARLGVVSIRAKADASVTGIGSGSSSESSTQAYGGLGLGYSFSKAVSLEGTYDFSRAEIVGEKGDVGMLTLGLRIAF